MRLGRCVLGMCLALGAPARADEQPPATATAATSKPLGIELSLRLGPAVPGNNESYFGGPLFPLWLGLGYRFGGVWYVGLAGVYAFGPTQVIGGQETSVYNTQFLAEVAVHPLGYARVDPWLSYGFGVEWFNGGTGNFVPMSVSFGVDFALSQTFRMGPFGAVQIAFHGSDTHNWYVVGLKLTALP